MVKPAANSKDSTGDPFEGTPYRLERPLARGGMGQVFLVEHRQLGRQLVAKILKDQLSGDPQLVDRFRIEAQSLGRLRHPNIVSIFGFGTTRDNRPFLVTEYLQGRTIAHELASGTVFTVHEAIRYARETLAALAAAHELGIVHRDIKPENLFIQQQPNGSTQIKVLDFGLARVIPGVSSRAPQPLVLPTDTGVVFGTPHYVSPEGALGQHVDHRADIYGVGLVLYTMLARQGPFDHANSKIAAMTAHLTEEPLAPSKVAKILIPPALDAIVLKALEKDPESRIQTAKEFEELLSEVANLPESSIRVMGATEGTTAKNVHPALTHSTDTSFEVPVSGGAASRFSPLGWPILIGVALLSALLVFIFGRLILVKYGGL